MPRVTLRLFKQRKGWAVANKKDYRIRILIAGATAGLVSVLLFMFHAFTAVEYQLYDYSFRLFNRSSAPPSEVVIVAIDPASLERIGRWPWPRLYHAEVLRQLARNGAKVIGVDIGFIEPDRNLIENDQALAEATREAANLSTIVFPVLIEKVVRDGNPFLVQRKPLPELVGSASGLGHVHIEQGSDGIVRKVYLSEEIGDQHVWSWGLEVLRLYLDLPGDAIRPTDEATLRLGDIDIPVLMADKSETAAPILHNYEMNIGFVGDRGTFEYVPAHRVIDGDFPEGYFRGKIVLYGGTAAGLFDMQMTPFSEARAPMPGVEIQANVINTVLKERFIRRAPALMVIAATVLAALVMGFAYARFETRVAAAMLVLLLLATVAGYCYAFSSLGLWVETSPVCTALILSFVFALMLKMRQVNLALDGEILNLSRAAELGQQSDVDRAVEIFRAAETTFRDLLFIPGAALLKVDRAKGTMSLSAQYGLSEARPSHLTVRIGSSLRGLLIGLDPIPLDGLKDHPLQPLIGSNRFRLHHSLFVPLVAQGETIGALCVLRPKGSPFRMEERELLQAISSELGSLWYNTDLYARLSRISSNPLAPFTYQSQERRIQTLSVLSDSVLGEKNLMTSIMDSIADGVVVTDVLGTIRVMNPKAKEILGLYAEDPVGQNAVEFLRRFHEVPYEEIREKFQKVVELGHTFSEEIRLSLPTTRFYTLTVGPVRSRDNVVQGIVAVLSDITELKEMDQMKTDLMSMVTHEIRTPLATVRGFAQILLKGGIPAEKATEFLEIINRQSNRLVNLVNDFLDITRIESGRQVITRGPMDMEKLIGNTLADLKPLADEKNIALEYESPSQPLPEVYADRNLIEQVLINLVSNAIKYSPKGAWTRVSLSQHNGHLRVDVRDNGLGIPQEAIPRLFEKFYRVRCDDRKDIIGTGLGLSLVKQIIDVHQGQISVQSQHGAGSTFTFTLPVGPPNTGTGNGPAAEGTRAMEHVALRN